MPGKESGDGLDYRLVVVPESFVIVFPVVVRIEFFPVDLAIPPEHLFATVAEDRRGRLGRHLDRFG